MNESVMPDPNGSGASTVSGSSPAGAARQSKRFSVVESDVPPDRIRDVLRRSSYVSISVDPDGHIDFASEVEPQHAEQMTDVLLLMLIKAREARQ